MIEIHEPELEALILSRMNTGGFTSIEDVLWEALQTSRDAVDRQAAKTSLDEVFAKVRGLADDLDFSRELSEGRSVDLS